ncbi:MAG: TetR/AcrR family transcriptional regulator [Sneathiella sp.]|nr:TetR/AcrR family transcriptional regulator [Sneathiella sp.]
MTQDKAHGKRRAASETRQSILDAAAHMFRDAGYAAVSLRGIAAAAEMKAGSVYYHFKSKEDIVLEVLNLGIERVHEAVQLSYADQVGIGTAKQVLSACVHAHLNTLLAHSDYTSANVRIYGQVPANVQQKALTVRRKYEKLWDDILQSTKSSGNLNKNVDLKVFRLMLIGSLNATLEWFDPAHGNVEELANGYVEILTNGLME